MELIIPFRIYVVDPVDPVRNDLIKELQSTGFQVQGEKSGLTVEHNAEKDPPDLFIITLEIPRLDGVYLIRKLRKSEIFENKPIIALTDKIDKQKIRQLQELVVRDVLKKPLEPGQLLKVAEKHYKLKVIADIMKGEA
jgi:DNA-binding response OmpR family regulator